MTFKLTAGQEKENRRLSKLSSGAEKRWIELGKPGAFIFRGHAVFHVVNYNLPRFTWNLNDRLGSKI